MHHMLLTFTILAEPPEPGYSSSRKFVNLQQSKSILKFQGEAKFSERQF